MEGRGDPSPSDETKLPEFLTGQVGKLEDMDRDNLDKEFTMEELEDMVKSLPYNKSPGLSGLSNEFYRKVFHIIKIIFKFKMALLLEG